MFLLFSLILQIYILCLYWALIKSSDIEIPFIIDTPYARIDETHRNNITSEYLSSISNQVIILSTNTEIDEKAYREIKPKLNGEYLIEYDDKNRKTNRNISISNDYLSDNSGLFNTDNRIIKNVWN